MVVIASDVGSIRNYITDGTSGYLVEQTGDDFNDAAKFAIAIKRFYENWDLAGSMGQHGLSAVTPHLMPDYLKNTHALMALLTRA